MRITAWLVDLSGYSNDVLHGDTQISNPAQATCRGSLKRWFVRTALVNRPANASV